MLAVNRTSKTSINKYFGGNDTDTLYLDYIRYLSRVNYQYLSIAYFLYLLMAMATFLYVWNIPKQEENIRK